MAATTLGKRLRSAGPVVSDSCPRPVTKRVRHSRSKDDSALQFVIHEEACAEGKSDCADLSSSAALPSSLPENQDENTSQRILTPKTPRHRDALSKKVAVTPRHRVDLIVKEALEADTPPPLPITPRTPATAYSEARRVFSRGAYTGPIIGRQQETEELESFISKCVSDNAGGCLYVSGPPGTGKSALVGQICRQRAEHTENLHYATVNCMSVKTASDIYILLRDELMASENVFVSSSHTALQQAFVNKDSDKLYFVMLDEIDQLLSLDLNVLYNLFEWSMQHGSRLILVGISNALDLTDRFLPKLKSRNLKPQLLPFLPYSVSQIATVLTARARSLLEPNSTVDKTFVPFLMPPAIQLIAKKVASQNGDLRKAFDIAQRAIDLVETETRDRDAQKAAQQTPDSSPTRAPLGENPNLSSPITLDRDPSLKKLKGVPSPNKSRQFENYTAENAPRASLSHVVRVTSVAFNNGTTQRLSGLNLQQKAVLCAMAALEQKLQRNAAKPDFPNVKPSPTPSKGVSAPTMRNVYETYSTLCRRDNLLNPLSITEFRDVVSNLETSSLVSAADGRGGMFTTPSTPSRKGRGGTFGAIVKADDRRVSSVFGAEELQKSLQDGPGVDVLRKMLSSDI